MEKGMLHLARYHCGEDLFVDVVQEDTGRPVKQDYWLCDKGSNCMRFMFSRSFRTEEQEMDSIRRFVQNYRAQTAV